MNAINNLVAELEEKLKQAQLELQRKDEENIRLDNGNIFLGNEGLIYF